MNPSTGSQATKHTIEDWEMFSLFELTPDLVCIAGKDGYFRKVNPAVVKKLGYSQEELLSSPVFSFMHPDDRDHTGKARKKLLKGEALLNLQNRYLAKDGSIVWLEWTSIFIPGKEIVFAIAKDITSRKIVEQEIEDNFRKYKSLARHFKQSIERDRKFLAVELHEELAQLASAVKLDIEIIKNIVGENTEPFHHRLDHALAASSLLINTIRRISFSISPNMIDDMGFDEVMLWLCREFSHLNGIPCTYSTSIDENSMSKEVQLDIFRICQEALTNAMYHAAATKVEIRMKEARQKIELSISDNGRGFDLHNDKQTPGFNSIRERAASINGLVEIETSPGRGTRVCVLIDR